MFKALILIVALTVISPVSADEGDIWIDINGISKHFGGEDQIFTDTDGRRREFNETNIGLGVTYEAGKWYEIKAGFYENTYYKTTAYAGANVAYDLRIGDLVVSPGVTVGLVTGYDDTPMQVWAIQPMAMPTLSVQYKSVRLNIGYMPLNQVFNRGNDIITFQLGLKF